METDLQRWQLSGPAAEIYQAHLVPAIFGPWAAVVVEAAGLRPGERVLDVACGTGAVAREAARRLGGHRVVVGLDNNPGMLAVAGSVSVPQGPPIEWREADATSMPFPEASFDVVLCQLGLQYFPDRRAALGEMRRILVPDGRVVLLVWQSIVHSPGFAALAEALERHVSTSAATIMRAPFAFDDAEQLGAAVTGAGFRDVRVRGATGTVHFGSVEDFVRYQTAGSPLAVPVGEATDDAREALIGDVSRAVQPYVTADGVAFPIWAHIATAHT
jgi:ubiquinone/menaquinone biosynthesis C-methylase UbiE